MSFVESNPETHSKDPEEEELERIDPEDSVTPARVIVHEEDPYNKQYDPDD
jgi:hypothetical protein